jgi:hypothetical protein
MNKLPTNRATNSNNKNSLHNKRSRYVGGGLTETADGKIEWWERSIFPKDSSDMTYVVENIYAHRLDLIASVFYKESRYAWFLAQYNNILDPFSEVVPGRILLIPTADRMMLMLGSRKGGVQSTKQPINTIVPIIT